MAIILYMNCISCTLANIYLQSQKKTEKKASLTFHVRESMVEKINQ